MNYRTIFINDKIGKIYLDSNGDYVELLPPIFDKFRSIYNNHIFYATNSDSIFIYNTQNNSILRPKYGNQFLTKGNIETNANYLNSIEKIVFTIKYTQNNDQLVFSEIYIYNYKKDSIEMHFTNLDQLIYFNQLQLNNQTIGIIVNNVYHKSGKRFDVEIINLLNPDLNYQFSSKHLIGIDNIVKFNITTFNYEVRILKLKINNKIKHVGYYNLNTGSFRS